MLKCPVEKKGYFFYSEGICSVNKVADWGIFSCPFHYQKDV